MHNLPISGTIASLAGPDLAAYLLRKGWAAALPGAPFEYQVLERIARTKGLGIWGFAFGESF